ncbi:MAG: peptidoglycan-binding protein [Proteobacteria bacterium]|nr:peptidoglycan-binding protein [Pseudomonadota bacterium]MDA0959455.1 peptidoglycan-binding protein [Pseudomonadota bacterium]MDA1152837.1 peptidoglycan-binding protein [Pseudomonadota bacterium]
MALARIGNARRVENFTWPGFVDALATLLMVIIFVLMVFVLIQVNLAYRVSGQDATLGEMRQQLASLGELLNIERRASADLAANLAQITNQLNSSNAGRTELEAELSSVQAALTMRNSEIAKLAARQADIEASLAAARASLEERLGALQLAEGQLAMAQAKNQSATNKIGALSAEIIASKTETEASRAEVAEMTRALAALRLRIEDLTNLLAEKERETTRDKVAIANLGRSLNNALATRVQELQRFRSEFFGRLRDVLKGRDDVQIVGDRFVFQSEVLFAQGQAEIGPQGQEQLAKLAITLADIAQKIPGDINWILQVDGHTDNVPIRAGRYADNWDLSTERALSVVRYLNQQGLPANRLAAAGYGEYQPLDASDSANARRKNRRIELKITQRVAIK